jgi:hypothetical protein
MLVSTMIEIDAVVAMSAIFACALAWAQLQTRHLTSTPAPGDRGPDNVKMMIQSRLDKFLDDYGNLTPSSRVFRK